MPRPPRSAARSCGSGCKHGVTVGDAPLTAARFNAIVEEETREFTGGKFAEAREMFVSLSLAPEFADFLTIPAYERIVSEEQT